MNEDMVVTLDEVNGVAADTLLNFTTNLNTSADKSTASYFTRRIFTEDELGAMYRFGGIAGKIIDVVPSDATRKWRIMTLPDGMDKKPFDELEKSLAVSRRMCTVGKWARLYGTAIVALVIKGHDDITHEPLIEESISRNNPLTELRVLNRYDLNASQIDKRTNRPSAFIDWRDGKTYHPSRILGPFDGIELPLGEYQLNYGWGGSILERCYDSLLNKAQAAAQISPLIHEALVKVVGIDDLSKYLNGGTAQEKFTLRWMVAKRLASTQNVFLHDKTTEEVKDVSSTSALQGLASLLEVFGQELAGECDIPMTRLQGKVTGGLNTSAPENLKDYYAMISSYQQNTLGPELNRLDRVLMRSAYSRVPEGFWSEWAPLDEPSEDESAATELKKAQGAEINYRIGAITPAHVSERLAKEGPYELSDEFLTAVKERDGLEVGEEGERKEEAVLELPEGVEAPGIGGAGVQSQVLNGAQISALIEISTKVKSGELAEESGVAIVRVAVPTLTEAEARAIVGKQGPPPPTAPPVPPVPVETNAGK